MVVPPVVDRRGDGRLFAHLGGEDVELLAARALYWHARRTLFVADVHLGKAATFRAAGIPLPRGTTAGDLARLSALLRQTSATCLVVLGDLTHAREGRVAALDAAFLDWRREHAPVAITLVRGNHDRRAGDPPSDWQVEVVDTAHRLGPFALCHEPALPGEGYALAGHLHPGARLEGRGGDSTRLPCFVLGPRAAVLPAFGRMTGLKLVAARADETRVAIAGTTLFPLPPAA